MINKLKIGDVVGVIAPSDSFAKKDLMDGIKEIESWGLRVKLGKYVFEDVDDYMAGSVEQRGEDFLSMVNDDEVKCIWCAEGGYAITPLRKHLNYELAAEIEKTKKILVGYSDITMFVNFWTNISVPAIYGPTLCGLSKWTKRSRDWMKSMLMENKTREMEIEVLNGIDNISGKLIPGGIECMQLGFGTSCDVLNNNDAPIILVLEDWNEEKTSLFRQLDSIIDHRDFEKVVGVLLGRFPLMTSESYERWSKKVNVTAEIARRLVAARSDLFIGNLVDFGHPSTYNQEKIEEFLAVPSGVRAEAKLGDIKGKLIFGF